MASAAESIIGSDPESESWRSRARCNTGDASLVALFFSEKLDDISRAAAFCGDCAVSSECFETAQARREPFGVWGGVLFNYGKPQKRNRRDIKQASSMQEKQV